MKEGNRLKAISLSIAGSISQLILHCSWVVVDWYFLSIQKIIMQMHLWVFFFLDKDLVVYFSMYNNNFIAVLFQIIVGNKNVDKDSAVSKYSQYISVLEEFTPKLLLRLLSLSLCRYLVFVMQYILLLQVLQVNMSLAARLLDNQYPVFSARNRSILCYCRSGNPRKIQY